MRPQPEASPLEPTLTVGLFTGLADRLKALLSARALAEASGRRLTARWARTVHCGAGFCDLFQSSWPVAQATEAEVRSLPLFDMGDRRRRSDLADATEPDLALRADGWLLDPARYPGHAALLQHCWRLLDELEPLPEIRQRVSAFRAANFRDRMIGAHLRRADYLAFDARSAGGTGRALAAVDALLEQWPDAGILLCTDDGGVDTFTGRPSPSQGVRAALQERYGERVVWSEPRSLDRREPVAVQDALVDLLLLRATDAVVGTAGSSFSELAAFGRGVPLTLCRSSNALLHLRPLWRWATGRMPTRAARFYYGRLLRQWLP